MSYAAEPYGQFVEDLLLSLTGGVVRERFVFLPEEEPFRLASADPILPDSVRVYGQRDGQFLRFQAARDFVLATPPAVRFLADANGAPAGDAIWPETGTPFYVSYRVRRPSGAAPRLTDTTPGSVTRLLAESFSREFAVLSQQLEAVYRAGFLATATGRDLDQLVALVGLERRTTAFATGTVIFDRSTPAPADINVPEGLRLSTREAPFVVFETTEDATLRRGALSVEVPVQALESGAKGLIPERLLTVIHQPILGIHAAYNPQATRFGGEPETDDALRGRAMRALETAGSSTVGAIRGALASLPGIRDKDVVIEEDHFAHPGIIKLTVAAELDVPTRRRAVELLEAARPAGIRVEHTLGTPETLADDPGPAPIPRDDPGAAPASPATPDAEGHFYPVGVQITVFPSSLQLTSEERAQLRQSAEDTAEAFIAEIGAGEPVVYNRLVAALLAHEGVYDVQLSLWAGETPPSDPKLKFRNVIPTARTVRPRLSTFEVEVGGTLVALDLRLDIARKGAGLLEPVSVIADEVVSKLQNSLLSPPSTITPTTLLGLLTPSDKYDVKKLGYDGMEWLESGIRSSEPDASLALQGTERVWIRSRTVTEVPA
jgi:phage-related baseplate assembly protein